MKIDLCCGGHPKQDFEGLDVLPIKNVKYVVDLNKEKLPFGDESVEEFYEQNSFYELERPMDVIKDCHRCLKIGGTLEFWEMHFSSHYAYLPYTKNFWSFATKRLFTPGYRNGYDWRIVWIDFDTGFEHSHPKISKLYKLYKLVIKMIGLNIYEKYFSKLFPIFRVGFKLKKVSL